MPRRKEDTKHPALAAGKMRGFDEQRYQQELEGIDGWDTFSTDQRKFLMVLSWHKSNRSAATAIGKDDKWVQRQYKTPKFRNAVRLGKDSIMRAAKQILTDIVGSSLLRLQEMVEPGGASAKVQLDAIKHIHSLTGLSNPDPATFSAQYIDADQVIMFGNDKPVQIDTHIEEPSNEIVDGVARVIDEKEPVTSNL